MGCPTENLSIAFDKVKGTLYQQGQPAMVNTWALSARRRFALSANNSAARNLVVVSGKIPLSEINHFLQKLNYGAEFYTRLVAGEFDS